MLTCAGFLALGARGVWSAERAAPRLVPRCSRLLEEGPASRSDPLGLDLTPAWFCTCMGMGMGGIIRGQRRSISSRLSTSIRVRALGKGNEGKRHRAEPRLLLAAGCWLPLMIR